MKKIYAFFFALLFTAIGFAQAPQGMSFQAVIRNSSDQLVTNHPVGMRISILQGSSSGTVVYTETQTATTNTNGLVSIEIGGGAGFGVIDWANNIYFIKTETDPTGGTTYTITGTNQLLSVPYALHAKTVATYSPHSIGDSYGGGIVFYVYDNGRHGLIAAPADQSTGIRWYAGTYTIAMAYADGVGAGKTNTAIIIANQGYGDGATYAARICNEYSVTVDAVTYGDWYLPSKYELNLLHSQKSVVGGIENAYYWNSTEVNSSNAWARFFGTGIQIGYDKVSTARVRAVRSF